MNIKVTQTTQTGVAAAVAEVKQGFDGFETCAVLFFASSQYDPQALSLAMHESQSDITSRNGAALRPTVW